MAILTPCDAHAGAARSVVRRIVEPIHGLRSSWSRAWHLQHFIDRMFRPTRKPGLPAADSRPVYSARKSVRTGTRVMRRVPLAAIQSEVSSAPFPVATARDILDSPAVR